MAPALASCCQRPDELAPSLSRSCSLMQYIVCFAPLLCSVTLGRYVASSSELYQQAAALLAGLRVPVEEIRGVGITVSQLIVAVVRCLHLGP